MSNANINLQESRQHVTIAATSPFAILAAVAVVARLFARRLQRLRLEFDDYVIILGLICSLGCFSLSMEMVHLGSGKHIQTVAPVNLAKYLKVSLVFCRRRPSKVIAEIFFSAYMRTKSCMPQRF